MPPARLRIVLLGLLMGAASCPDWNLFYHPTIDGALHWAFNYFADGHYEKARSTLFPHGPLAFLLYPVTMGNNAEAAVLVHVLTVCLLVVQTWQLNEMRAKLHGLVLFALLGIFLLASDLQLNLVFLTALNLFFFQTSAKKKYLLAAILLSVLNLFIKTYGGVISGLMIAFQLGYSIIESRRAWPLLTGAATWLLLFFTGWMLLFQSPAGMVNFLRAQAELSYDNSDAVQYAFENNWRWLTLFFASLGCIPFVVRDLPGRYLCLLFLLPIYAAWKHAMGRVEAYHMAGFLYFLFMVLLLLLLVQEKLKPALLFVVLICAGSFLMNLVLTTNYLSTIPHSYRRLNLPVRMLSDRQALQADKERDIRYTMRDQHLPDTLRKLIGQERTDVYPWNYTLIAANKLNWQPRPVLNSYASYTGWLDRQDSIHFVGPNAPRFLLWHLSDPADRGFDLESIDNRFLLNDEPAAVTAMLARYSLVYSDGQYTLYRRSDNPLNLSVRMLEHQKLHFGEWVSMPAHTEGAILRAKLEIRKTFSGRLRSLLYRGSIFYVFYELSDGRIISHRFVPKNAADGIWLHPLQLLPSCGNDLAGIKRIKLVCHDPQNVEDEVSLNFTETLLKKNDTIVDAAAHIFGISSGGRSGPGVISPEQSSSVGAYLPNMQLRKIKMQGLSRDSVTVIPPGQRSGIFTLPVKKVLIPKGCTRLRYLFTANVKTVRNTRAVMVASRNVLHAEAERTTWEMKYSMESEKDWTTVQHFLDLRVSEVQDAGDLKFYLINSDSEAPVYLDGCFVSVYFGF